MEEQGETGVPVCGFAAELGGRSECHELKRVVLGMC